MLRIGKWLLHWTVLDKKRNNQKYTLQFTRNADGGEIPLKCMLFDILLYNWCLVIKYRHQERNRVFDAARDISEAFVTDQSWLIQSSFRIDSKWITFYLLTLVCFFVQHKISLLNYYTILICPYLIIYILWWWWRRRQRRRRLATPGDHYSELRVEITGHLEVALQQTGLSNK